MSNKPPVVLPCPFCGHSAEVAWSPREATALSHHVYCPQCGVRHRAESAAWAIRKWNRRTSSDVTLRLQKEQFRWLLRCCLHHKYHVGTKAADIRKFRKYLDKFFANRKKCIYYGRRSEDASYKNGVRVTCSRSENASYECVPDWCVFSMPVFKAKKRG